jgi:beta-galactosidase
MAHGGSTWGFMAGANFDPAFEPDISSYDYDAPIDEAAD